ncbi:MAG: hypothetical protein ACTMIR_07145 [Cellulomonadaceae bacterium]
MNLFVPSEDPVDEVAFRTCADEFRAARALRNAVTGPAADVVHRLA